MTSTGNESRAVLALRWGLGLLLLWAAVSKIANLTSFLGSINAYELPLPRSGLKVVAIVLPWVELLCGLLLIGRVWPETSLMVAGTLFAVFLVATGQAWARGLKIACGCFDLSIFGVDKEHSQLIKFIENPGFAFVRNLGLLGAVLVLAKHFRRSQSVPNSGSQVWRKGSTPPASGEPLSKGRPGDKKRRTS